MPWYQQFDSIFWISTGTIFAGIIVAGYKMCYRSKCQRINLCYGCVLIDRDTTTEAVVDQIPAPAASNNLAADVESGAPSVINTPARSLIRDPLVFEERQSKNKMPLYTPTPMKNKRASVILRKTTNTLHKVNSVAQPALGVAGIFGVPGASAAAKVLTGAETVSKAARKFV